MKGHIYKILFFIFLILFFLNMFWIIYQSSFKVEQITHLTEPLPINKANEIYVYENNTILVHDSDSGIFQCFDFNGNFVWGIHLQTTKNTDDTLVSINNDKLYFWEGKTNTVYVYKDFQLVSKETHDDILWRKNFFSYYPIENNSKYHCKFALNGSVNIMDMNNSNFKNIRLNTRFNYYSFSNALIGVILSLTGFLYTKEKIEHIEQGTQR